MVHRDLKPANVLIAADGRAAVADFGLSAAAGVASTHAVGTAGWTAPEQSRPGPVTPAADVYAVGRLIGTLPLPGLQPSAARCVADEPATRPTLPDVREAVDAERTPP